MMMMLLLLFFDIFGQFTWWCLWGGNSRDVMSVLGMVCSAQGTDLFPVTFQCQARASLRNLIVVSFGFLFSWITTNQELQSLQV